MDHASYEPPASLPAWGNRTQDLEDALRHPEGALTEACRIARLGVWSWDWATGRITVSEEVHRIFGCAADSAPALFADHRQLLTPDSRARHDAAVAGALHTSSIWRSSVRMAPRDGSACAARWIGA
jgi:PAS domain-containing protein